jgi:hypothetical protein
VYSRSGVGYGLACFTAILMGWQKKARIPVALGASKLDCRSR